ncbi:MAG: VOC family protein [Pseudomonadota bacterium]
MTQTDKPPVRFQRGNFVVRDLDRALSFYRDVLGFTVEFIKASDAASYSYPVFEIPREAKLRFAVLSTEGAPRCMALTEVAGVDIGQAETPRRGAIVLDMADIDAALDGARKLGLQIYPEETLHTQDGRTGREVGVVDADGNLVVLYTITAYPSE